MTIDTAQPGGRELDALVAERVMELPQVERVGERLQCRNDLLAREHGGTWRSVVPEYSTEIAAAMQVTEKMLTDEWEVEITSNDYRTRRKWFVRFSKDGDGYEGGHGADSLTEAICRAALAAIGPKE